MDKKELYYRLRDEGFVSYMSEDEPIVYYEINTNGRMMYIKILESGKYLLQSTDDMMSLIFDTPEALLKMIFFISHCM